MSYVALYREWRPKTFDDIIGQEHITRTLKNQIKQGRIAHAYLFCGTRGTGKTTTAKVLSKAVNCLHPVNYEPCGKCEICTGIDNGSIMDVIEIDAASNRKVENVRDLIDSVKLSPYKARYKVYIIDEVHMLTTEAFNTLLKTLEEPPGFVIFILATTEMQKVPATILSRCQRFDFKRIKTDEMVGRLKDIALQEGINADDKALSLIARNSDGAMRDALSIFDQCMSLNGNDVNYNDVLSILGIAADEYLLKITDAVAECSASKCIALIDDLILNGKDVYQFIKDMTMHFRNLLVCKMGSNAIDIINISEEMFNEFMKQSDKFSTEAILKNINILSEAEYSAKWSSQPRIILEMAAIRMCRKELNTDVNALLERIARLERAVSGGIPGNLASGQQTAAADIKKQSSAGTSEKQPVQEAKKDISPVPEKADSSKKKVEEEYEIPDISLEEVAKKWSDILKAVRNGKHMTLYAFMVEGKPISLSKGILTVAFDDQYAFNKIGLEKSENRSLAEEYIASVCGCKLKIHCAMMDEIAADSQKQEQEEDDFVKKSISIFGKDIVEIKE